MTTGHEPDRWPYLGRDRRTQASETPRRHTAAYQAELDGLIDRLNAGSLTIRSSWRWQLWTALAWLAALPIPVAILAARVASSHDLLTPLDVAMGTIVLLVLVVEARLIVRMATGTPRLTMTREGFSLGGGTASWLHVLAVTAPAARRRLAGQQLTAFLVDGRLDEAAAALPLGARLRHRLGRVFDRATVRSTARDPRTRFLPLIRHPDASADVVADLASFLCLRARD